MEYVCHSRPKAQRSPSSLYLRIQASYSSRVIDLRSSFWLSFSRLTRKPRMAAVSSLVQNTPAMHYSLEKQNSACTFTAYHVILRLKRNRWLEVHHSRREKPVAS